MPETADPLGWVGHHIDGRFAVKTLVGEGGFGVVYRGVHLGFDEPVAIKCLKAPGALSEDERSSFLADLKREGRLLHQLSRKTTGIVQALDVGAASSPGGAWTPYIVMEWLDGHTLEDEVVGSAEMPAATRSLDQAVAILSPVAAALAVTHLEGIAHLDVKPANIFIGTDGTIKLLDFGIAKVLSSSDTLSRAMTRTGTTAACTPMYAAPEQFNRRHGPTGPRTDVFALALILIELCSGEPALEGDTPLQLYVASANEQYRPSLASRGVRVSGAVDDVIRRALEVDPRRRFRDAGHLWQALQEAMGGSALSAAAPAMSWVPPASPPVAAVTVVPTRSSGDAVSPLAHTSPLSIAPTTGLNRVCTVLLAELSGTAEASELLDPDQLDEIVERCSRMVASCVEALGGTVERVVGDSLMAVFGLYDDSATAAERAVHAALRMSAELATPPPGPRTIANQLGFGVCVGISTGRVFVKARQGTRGFELQATGRPVKRAARLQQGAPDGAVIIDRDTYRQVAGLFEIEAMEHSTATTRTTAGKCYRVRGAATNRYAMHVAAVRDFCGLDTRFIGRAAEVEALGDVIETVSSEPCSQLVTLLGPPGVGRSRLLAEIGGRLDAEQWVVLAERGSAMHTGTSYALVAALLRARFHIHEDDDTTVVSAKLQRGITELRGLSPLDGAPRASVLSTNPAAIDHDVSEIVEQLLRLLGLHAGKDERSMSADEPGQAARHRVAGAVASMLRSAGRPVALLCDDLQWADEASLWLLEALRLRLADAPLLIVSAARPSLLERRPQWGEDEQAHTRIEVRPLKRARLEALARDRLRRVDELPAALVRRLAEHADGNPLVLVETLHLLLDTGAIESRQGEAWVLHTDRIGELALPASIHGIVQARLDRLDQSARDVLARAAVVGRTFWDGALREIGEPVTTQRPSWPQEQLAMLRERGHIRAQAISTFPDEQELVFTEQVTQRTAYEMLSHKQRRALHLLVAKWLEPRTTSDAGAALIARHYERAAALPEAIAAYRRAGAHAASLGQHAEARQSYGRACHIDDWIGGEADVGETTGEIYLGWEQPAGGRLADWPERAALRIELGDALRHMGCLDEAERRYREAAERVVPVERRDGESIDPAEVPRFQARVAYRRADLEKTRGKLSEPVALLEEALPHAAAGGLVEERAEMLALLASLQRRAGEPDACRRACLDGLHVCRQAAQRGPRWRQAVSKLLNTLGTMFFSGKQWVRAERCYLQAARAVDERRNPEQASQALNNVAAARYTRGDLDGARACFRRVLALSERSGDLWMRTTALANLGEVELARGRGPLAVECLGEAVRLGEQIRATLDLPEAYRHLARAELGEGRAAAALSAARRALALGRSAQTGRTYLPAVLETAAKIYAAATGGDPLDGASTADLRALARDITAVLEGPEAAALEPEQVSRCRQLIGSG